MQQPVKILQASAGSGKTFSLAAHYITLLFSGENKYRDILAVTFTNKATEEMKTRIMEVLKGLATDDEKVKGYKKIVQQTHPALDDKALQLQADKIYRKILHDYSRFSASTIDGFVQKVIRSFTFELGISSDYALELNLEKVKNELLERLEQSLTSNPYMIDWIIQLSLEKINDNKSWNLKVELADIIKELFKESFTPFEDAISELKTEDVNILFNEYVSITKTTINNYKKDIKSKIEKAIQIFKNNNLDISDFKGGAKSWLCKLETLNTDDEDRIDKALALANQPEEWFKKGRPNPSFYEQLNPVFNEIITYRDENRGGYKLALAFKQNMYYLRLLREVAALLTTYRNENGNLLISDAQKLVTGITDDAGDNPSFIWEKTGSRYRNFLFDEFQDTSTSQWKSFCMLLSNAISSPTGKYIDHLIVGDVKQSIYRWRSGDWDILHQQAKEKLNPANVIESSLEENYRSAKNIIQFNNSLFQTIPKLLQQSLNSTIDTETTSTKQWWHKEGFDEIIKNVYATSTQMAPPTAPEDGMIIVKKIIEDDHAKTPFKEEALNCIEKEINNLINKHNYQYKDIALLVRTNAEAELCVNKLMSANLPVLSGDALLISNNPAIDLVINTLKVFVAPEAQSALYKANCIALYHSIHQKQIDTAAYFNLNNLSLSQLNNVLPATLCSHWKSWLQFPFAELAETLFEVYGLTQLPQHTAYLLAFRDLISNATRVGEKGITGFLEWWEEEGTGKALPSPESANAIQIITIHKSKGLAFRAVFIPFCNWDLKPKSNDFFWVTAADTPYHQLGNIPLRFNEKLAGSTVSNAYFKELMNGYMDSLNLLYVATTRTKDFLYIATMGKKSDTLTTIGDILNKAIVHLFPEFTSTNLYQWGTISSLENNPIEETSFNLNYYPTSGRLSKLYEASEEKNIAHLLNIEATGRKGSLAHEALANASNEKEVDDYLNGLLHDGVISKSELPDLKIKVMEVLTDPQIMNLFKNAEYSIIEKSIIDSNGKLQRPDRILINNNEVVLLDYKFTSQQSPLHREQILKYRNLLEQIGFKQIQSYLYYANEKELKPVV